VMISASALPYPPANVETRLPRFLDPPHTHDVLTSALLTDSAHIYTPPYSQLHPFSRSAAAVTPTLPGQPAEMPLSTTTRVHPPAVPMHDTPTSALPRPLIVPGDLPFGDYTMQRPAAPVDSRNLYTNTASEQLLAQLPPPMLVSTRPTLPLLSEHIQTTASQYVNRDFVPAHRYANTPFDSNYQNISASLSLPIVSTLANVPTHVGTAQSYTDDSQPVPIAVEQAGLPNFSRVDDSRPAVADSAVHYAEFVRPTSTAHTAPLQSPSVHWRKRFAYEYVQPDTRIGASIHAAPAIHPGYSEPQTSDTHPSVCVHLQTSSIGDGYSTTSVGLPPRPPPPPTSYLPHSHMMPLQLPTVPSAMPPPSHLPLQDPISSSSETNVTYLHEPPTHTVFADVHAPFTQQSFNASASAPMMSAQSQSTTAMHTHSAVNFNALPTGLTANADTVVPPPTAMPPPMPPTTVLSTPVVTVPQSFVQSVPTFIVKQPQMPKPYSGVTSYQSFKEHFERICRVNAWTSTEDKVQNLTLALEGPAAEILKDVNEASRLRTMKFGHC